MPPWTRLPLPGFLLGVLQRVSMCNVPAAAYTAKKNMFHPFSPSSHEATIRDKSVGQERDLDCTQHKGPRAIVYFYCCLWPCTSSPRHGFGTVCSSSVLGCRSGERAEAEAVLQMHQARVLETGTDATLLFYLIILFNILAACRMTADCSMVQETTMKSGECKKYSAGSRPSARSHTHSS